MFGWIGSNQEETVTRMDDDPFLGMGLRSVELADRAMFDSHFASLSQPLSDYSFSQLYTWRKSLKIYWRMLENHLCVFANGTGDLTLLLPPVGDGRSDRALDSAYELMDEYNGRKGVIERSRIEYVSDELAARFDAAGMERQPMGADYIYDLQRMIDLAGGDLASKRQAKNRFMRNYEHRVELYDAARHADGCRRLLANWKQFQDQHHAADSDADTTACKRAKESTAADVCLDSAHEIGLRGMVVWVKDQAADSQDGWSIRGFTFGEDLGPSQSNITVEKTDLEVKGLAQFIFSEFCARCWTHKPQVNVGDDWGLESIAWTKTSYRPIDRLNKQILRRSRAVSVAMPPAVEPAATPEPTLVTSVRAARKADLLPAAALEMQCFTRHQLNRRQLQYLQSRPTAVFLVAEREGEFVGDGIALVRHHRRGVSGRIYSLAVDDAHRGRKIGQKLLTSLLEELGRRGVRKTYLEVDHSNAAAVALYEKVGFKKLGVLADYYGPGASAIHMVYESTAEIGEAAPLACTG